MLRQILAESELQDGREFMSPKMFQVMPLTQATTQFRRVVQNHFNSEGWRVAVLNRQRWLDERHLPILIDVDGRFRAGEGTPGGKTVLELYFHQLYYGKVSLLDLRYDRFGGQADGRTVWAPDAYWVEWDQLFIEATRDLYLGFYLDEDARFERALKTMGVECAREVFVEHFGGGEQREVAFRIDRFAQTFRATLTECKRAGKRAHPNLIPFGMYIVTLYDHMEQLGGTWDVREAFFSAVDVDEFR